jgi:spermidine synthase
MMDDLFFVERDPFSPIRYTYQVQQVIHSEQSEFQEILVFDCAHFGRVLVLDGVVQVTSRDEFIYHEMLTHVALHAHPQPENVLIIGGGDGGTIREVAKHKLVKRIDLVELDRRVVEVSRQFLPAVATSFDDPRLNMVFMDGAMFFQQSMQTYDVIIIDCTDPVGPAESLFSDSFFADAVHRLTPDGILVIQTESLHFHRSFVADVQRRLSQLFDIVDLFTVSLATYAGNWWTFSIGSKKHDPRHQARICEVPAKYYSDDVHAHSFLPKSLYKKLIQD